MCRVLRSLGIIYSIQITMNYKKIGYTVLPLLVIATAGVGIASAQGFGMFGFNNLTPDEIATRQQTKFQNEAQVLGISVDDVKNGWAKGENLSQIAQDHGITQDQLQQKMKDIRTQELKTRLQTLVDKGVITQAQADQRLNFMNTQTQNGMGMMGRGHRIGFGHGGFWGSNEEGASSSVTPSVSPSPTTSS